MATINVGPECSKLGIDVPMLLSDYSALPELEIITNELVLELATFKDKHSQCTYKNLYT